MLLVDQSKDEERRPFLTRKVLAFSGAAVVILLLGFVMLLSIDGIAYERWKAAMHLRMSLKAWQNDGAPEPFNVLHYGGRSAGSTTSLSSASFMIDGRTYQPLLSYRWRQRHDETFFITKDGDVLIQPDGKDARILKIHKTKGAAW